MESPNFNQTFAPSSRPYLGDTRATHEQARKAAQNTEQKPTKEIPGMWTLFRILLLTVNEYLITLLPVIQLCVSLVIGVMRKGTDNVQAKQNNGVEVPSMRKDV